MNWYFAASPLYWYFTSMMFIFEVSKDKMFSIIQTNKFDLDALLLYKQTFTFLLFFF